MGAAAIGLDFIDHLTGGKLGTHDITCPLCGPLRRAPINQRRPVLRIWREEPGFATFHCARCGESGHARNRSTRTPDPIALRRAKAEAAERERVAKGEQLSKARWLWSVREPIGRSPGETYLRQARGYAGPLPATLGYLPPRGKHGPAMIAAFGVAHEIEPGVIAITNEAVQGVHITRLMPDGSDRERGHKAKIMIGRSAGWPIVLAPLNDLLGLVISEGIENGLSAHEASGLGAWAAGCAARMPTLVDVIPSHVDCLTVVADDDNDGRRFATEATKRASPRGVEARLFFPARMAAIFPARMAATP